MLTYFIYIFILFVSFAATELAAWFAHKYIMHGFMWHFHKDHHLNSEPDLIRKNDIFIFFLALPAFILFISSLQFKMGILLAAGLGISLYLLIYIAIHEILIHGRFFSAFKNKNNYLVSLQKAHKDHHRFHSKKDGLCFGLLWVPIKYYHIHQENKKIEDPSH